MAVVAQGVCYLLCAAAAEEARSVDDHWHEAHLVQEGQCGGHSVGLAGEVEQVSCHLQG